ncbi:Retrotransposable element Tf2 [Quillaja saponaria]|uniref:Retrotransposable element Tf2 n=1 Tax=Quillaja saponaria TaxID=32244 RepID=A0AAD7PQ09_QUISA|nr:Retrotransposable element Tf2 [Quillaja saponaria]
MAPYEALYGRRCRSPICWTEASEKQLLGPDLVQQTTEAIRRIRDKLRVAQSRQKSYADKRRRPLTFEVGDHVFLKRKLPSPGFHVEVVMIDYDGSLRARSMTDSTSKGSEGTSGQGAEFAPKSSKSKTCRIPPPIQGFITAQWGVYKCNGSALTPAKGACTFPKHQPLMGSMNLPQALRPPNMESAGASEIKSVAADASVFSFGDAEEFDSE